MEYRLLGETGVKLSVLGLGCSNFGERTSEKEAEKIILTAFENGINFIDTANVYPNQGLEGKSETIIGKILRKHDLRDKFFLSTKVRARMGEGPNDSGLSKYHILKQINGSLKRLQTDHIDLYQLHHPDHTVAIEEQTATMDILIKQNRILYFGLSSFSSWELIEFLWNSEKKNFSKCVSVQSKYNLFDRAIESDICTVGKKYKISVFAYSPLDGGLLTGKYALNKPLPLNARHTIWGLDFKKIENKKKLKKVEKLLKIAEKKKTSLTQLSIARLLHNKDITSYIIGPRTTEHLKQYLSALEVTLSYDEIDKIDKICPPEKIYTPSKKSMFR